METGDGKVKRKHFLKLESGKEGKRIKISIRPTQGLEPINSGAEEKSCGENCDLARKNNPKEKGVDKTKGRRNNDSPQRETGLADHQKDDKTSPSQFKSACNEMEQDQEGCFAPPPKSERHAGLRVRVRQDPSFDSQEQLRPEKVDDGESLDSLAARKAELKQQNSTLSRKLQRLSTECMQLMDVNRILGDELELMCGPSIVETLEAMNPDGSNPQTHEERSSQSTVAPSESSLD